MKQLAQQFLSETDSSKPQNDISLSLSRFKVKVTPELCKGIESKKLIGIFEAIFMRLYECSESKSASVRVSSFPAQASFILKLVRFYPFEMQKSFISFATKNLTPSKGSIMIIFGFALICNFIAKPFLTKFTMSVPIYHHFTNCDSDQLYYVIECLPELDDNYILALLSSFIGQYQKTTSPQLINPIQKIVQLQPDRILPEIIKSNEITLIAHMFTTLNVNADKYDLKEIAHKALSKIKNHEHQDIEVCFQILSIKSKSFNCKCSFVDENNKEILISVDDDSAVLNIDEFSKFPYFFTLSLPKSILLPKDDDPAPVISRKFQTISKLLNNKNEIIDVDDFISIFSHFCLRKYGDTASAALKSLALSLPCLIANATNYKLVGIIKSIFKTKIKSWVHGFDVLSVIKGLSNKLYEFIPLRERIQLLLELVMNKKETLSDEAIKVICFLTNETNFLLVTSIIAKNIDFFELYSIQKHLKALSKLIHTFHKQDRHHLDWICETIFSYESFYINDIHTLAEIFDYIQFFKYLKNVKNIFNSMNYLHNISYAILTYAILFLKGSDYSSKVPSEFTFYKEKIDNYINTKSIDITTERPYNFSYNFPLIYHAFSYYSKNFKDKKDLEFMIENLFDYFPYESTKLILLLDDKQFPNKIYSHLAAVTNSHVIGIWCKLIKNDFIASFARFYLNHLNMLKNADDVLNMMILLDSFDHKYDAQIIVSILDMPKFLIKDFVILALKNQQFSLKYSEQINYFSSFLCEDFDKKDDFDKIELIRKIIYSDNNDFKTSDEINNFAITHLKGWDLVSFRMKTNNFHDNELTPRVFNRNFKSPHYDDLNRKLEFFSDIDDEIRVKVSFHQSLIKGEIIDIGNIDLEEKYILLLANYYHKRGISINFKNKDQYDINNILKILLNQEFIQKKNVVKLCKLYQYLHKNSNDIFQIIKILFESYSIYINLTFKLMCLVINDRESTQIPKDFIDFYFSYIKQNINDLPIKEVAYSLQILSKKIIFENEHDLVFRSLFGKCGLYTVDFSYLFSTMIYLAKKENKDKIIFGNIKDIIDKLFESEIPSLFISALQILKNATNLPDLNQITDIIQPYMPKILSKVREVSYNFPCIRMLKNFFEVIFHTEALNKHPLIDSIINDIIPMITEIYEFKPLLSTLISYVSIKNSIYPSLSKLSDDLLEAQLNIRTILIYIDSINSRIHKAKSRETPLLKFISTYAEKTANFDSYFIEETYKKWAYVIKTNISSDLTMVVIVQQLMPFSVRFFPIFTVLAKEVMISTNNQLIQSTISNAINIIQNEAHICALELLLNKSNYRESLGIALLELNQSA